MPVQNQINIAIIAKHLNHSLTGVIQQHNRRVRIIFFKLGNFLVKLLISFFQIPFFKFNFFFTVSVENVQIVNQAIAIVIHIRANHTQNKHFVDFVGIFVIKNFKNGRLSKFCSCLGFKRCYRLRIPNINIGHNRCHITLFNFIKKKRISAFQTVISGGVERTQIAKSGLHFFYHIAEEFALHIADSFFKRKISFTSRVHKPIANNGKNVEITFVLTVGMNFFFVFFVSITNCCSFVYLTVSIAQSHNIHICFSKRNLFTERHFRNISHNSPYFLLFIKKTQNIKFLSYFITF